MNTINEVMHFLNKLELNKEMRAGEFKNFKCIKEVLKNELWDVNPDKLIIMLGVVDDLHIFYLIRGFKKAQLLTDVLYDDNFLLFKGNMEKYVIVNIYILLTYEWL